MEKDDKTIILRSFSNIKNVDIKVYKIGNMKLWQPVSIEAFSIFCASEAIMLLINSIIALPLPAVIKYFAIPVGLTYIIKTARIDGKKPHIYLLRLLEYNKIKNKTIERFEIKEDIEEIKFE
ncbi:MAG: TcpE family conjugal transfer membrane protein [Clostridium sp.]|uniref:TcpE family conjugal transfer membrane protein n=1 Tax=Clostridium sp. TaxID=1506 RepID=UPI003F2E17D2